MKMSEEKLNEEVVSKVVAQKEIETWLEYKKIGPIKREDYASNISTMVEAIMQGHLELDPETKKLTHKLKFPFGAEKQVSQVVYKPRVDYQGVRAYLDGVKASDFDERLVAYFSALTDEPKNYFRRMDSEDQGIAKAIALFFV
jgi:hypothetical protein